MLPMKLHTTSVEVSKHLDLKETKVANKAAKLTRILIRMYSNPFIWIQELPCNALDAHKEAGVDLPVEVRTTEVGDLIEVSVVDFGTGMSPDRVHLCYSFLESTKDQSNDQKGGFGLGSKSPLIYTESFSVMTIHDGTQYNYVVTVAGGNLSYGLISSFPSKERNQTHIKVMVKRKDVDLMVNFAEKALAFQTGISWGGEFSRLNNQKTHHFKTFSINSTINELCINYDGVHYPINYQVMPQLKNYSAYPLGIKFSIGEVEPLPSREDLDYSEETRTRLHRKVLEAVQEFKDYVKSKPIESDVLTDLIPIVQRGTRVVPVGDFSVTSPVKRDVVYTKDPTKPVEKLLYYMSNRGFKVIQDDGSTVMGGSLSKGSKVLLRVDTKGKRVALYAKQHLGFTHTLDLKTPTDRDYKDHKDYYAYLCSVLPKSSSIQVPKTFKLPVVQRNKKVRDKTKITFRGDLGHNMNYSYEELRARLQAQYKHTPQTVFILGHDSDLRPQWLQLPWVKFITVSKTNYKIVKDWEFVVPLEEIEKRDDVRVRYAERYLSTQKIPVKEKRFEVLFKLFPYKVWPYDPKYLEHTVNDVRIQAAPSLPSYKKAFSKSQTLASLRPQTLMDLRPFPELLRGYLKAKLCKELHD